MKNVIRWCVVMMLGFTVSTIAASAAVPNYQGLWYKAPAESEAGWGINLAHQGDVIFLTWFTYDVNGKAWWLTMTANKTADGVYSGNLIRTNGAPFYAYAPPATVTTVGTGTLSFTSPTTGNFTYTINDPPDVVAQTTKTIVLQTFGPVPTCVWGAQPNLAAATNYQDLWYKAPAESEAGWGINLTQQGTIIFATWFTYDANHNPLWLYAIAPQTGPNTFAGGLTLTGGPAFNAVPFDPSKVTRTTVGTATFAFSDGNTGTFTYNVDLGDGVNKTAAPQAKAITRQVFRTPGTVCQAASAGVTTAEGLWTGTTGNNQTVKAIILDDGSYYILYSNAGESTESGVVQGSSIEMNGIFTSSDGVDFPTTFSTFGGLTTVSGSYVSRSSLQLTLVEAAGTRSFLASYDATYEQPASLAAVAGSYAGISGHVSDPFPMTASIDFNGNIMVTHPLCTFVGTAVPHGSVNVFDLSVTTTSGVCLNGVGNTVNGVLYYDATKHQIHGLAPFSLRTDEWFLIGTKQ
jgi:hypothetical protein